ncbi:MAG: sensor histidine kinase [Tepidisphaeraceae bacterium]
MHPRPIVTRLILPFAAMIVLVVAVCGGVIWWAGQRMARAQQIGELERIVTLVREQLTDSSGVPDSAQQKQIRALADVMGTRVTLIDSAGRVLFDTHADATILENHNDRPEIVEARRVGAGSSVRFSHTISEQAVYVAKPLDPESPNGVILRLSYPQHVLARFTTPTWAIAVLAVVVATALFLWMMLLLNRMWVGSVRELASAAGKMKTDFVANASHELRTPIAAIKIAFETLQEVYREDPRQTSRCISIIEGHLHRLEEMLTDLLDLSRVESADIEPQIALVDVDDIFSDLRATMGPMARQKGIELELQSDPAGPARFESDRKLLGLVLKNLVENSLKFTPSGGKVLVSCEAGADDVALCVRDTGIGIPPEHLERVFERFYQVDAARSSAAGRGTGLGLAIVKHAIHALGGTVDLKSTVGAGTTVTCRLPQHAMAEVGRV